MAEDWDLYAVVRGCRSATSAAGISTTATISRATTFSRHTCLSSLATSPFKEENDPFAFPSPIQPRSNGFKELHQLFIPSIPTTTTTNGCSIYPNSPFPGFSDAAGSINPALPGSNIRPHFVLEASTCGFERFHDHHEQQTQQQQQQQKHIQNQLQVLQQQQFQVPGQISSHNNPANTLQNENKQAAQTPRSRKRKSQQKRMVCHVTAENLSADLWAWRKYGQKPIKGSPYPRNYYRCSSSKGCSARKQVERSNTDPDKFIVTYTGDHTHPRPTHRNTLAGSTRNKPSTTHQPTIHESGSPGNIASTASSSSFLPLSPRTPLTAKTPNEECADGPMLSNEAVSTDPDNEPDIASESEDDILIPNMAAVMENIFLGAHHFRGGSGSSGGSGDSRSDNMADGSSPNSQPRLTPASKNQISHLSRSSPG